MCVLEGIVPTTRSRLHSTSTSHNRAKSLSSSHLARFVQPKTFATLGSRRSVAILLRLRKLISQVHY